MSISLCVFIKSHTTAQPGPVIVINATSKDPPYGGWVVCVCVSSSRSNLNKCDCRSGPWSAGQEGKGINNALEYKLQDEQPKQFSKKAKGKHPIRNEKIQSIKGPPSIV